MGGGVLARHGARTRNRSFAALCGALAVWNLGFYLGVRTGWAGWRPLMLAGSCAIAPLGLDFAARLAGWPSRRRRGWVTVASLAAVGLWAISHSERFGHGTPWSRSALVVLGGTLAAGIAILVRSALARSPGSERRALLAIVWGALIAVAGGLSDFIPRESVAGMTRLGPLALLVFLLVVSVVLARHRFLDADRYVLRVVTLLAGAATTAALFHFTVHRLDVEARFLTLFAVALLVLAAAGPVGRVVLAGASSLFAPPDPLARALMQVSRKLPGATRAGDVWGIVDEGRRAFSPGVRLAVFLHDRGSSSFHLAHRAGPEPGHGDESVDAGSAMVELLDRDRLPLTPRGLSIEADDVAGEKGRLADTARSQMERLGAQLVVPLLDEDRLRGWIALGGGIPERSLNPEVAAALMAVGNQAAESLDRIAAVDLACRHESLAAVGELAAGLAHEVRNPLAAIRGATQALGPQATPAVIDEETERLGRVVGEFLDYARPDSPRREPLDLPALTREAVRGLRLAGAALTIDIEVEDGVRKALGDPDQIRRVLDNLLRNAWEAAGDDGSLRIRLANEGERSVAVRLEDNGPGIPHEQVTRIFQPFHTTKPGGTGLGLALVHRIVEAHGGEIRVDGRPGLGAAFVVTLPMMRP